MYDAEALSGKSLAELREIGKKLGIKAQMRKQALIDKILEQSERPEAAKAPSRKRVPQKLRKATIRCRKNGKDAKRSMPSK